MAVARKVVVTWLSWNRVRCTRLGKYQVRQVARLFWDLVRVEAGGVAGYAGAVARTLERGVEGARRGRFGAFQVNVHKDHQHSAGGSAERVALNKLPNTFKPPRGSLVVGMGGGATREVR